MKSESFSGFALMNVAMAMPFVKMGLAVDAVAASLFAPKEEG
jgi:hypothetical protein